MTKSPVQNGMIRACVRAGTKTGQEKGEGHHHWCGCIVMQTGASATSQRFVSPMCLVVPVCLVIQAGDKAGACTAKILVGGGRCFLPISHTLVQRSAVHAHTKIFFLRWTIIES